MSATEILAALTGGALGWIVGAAVNGLHSLRRPSVREIGDGAGGTAGTQTAEDPHRLAAA